MYELCHSLAHTRNARFFYRVQLVQLYLVYIYSHTPNRKLNINVKINEISTLLHTHHTQKPHNQQRAYNIYNSRDELRCQTSYFQNYNTCVIYMIISLKHFGMNKNAIRIAHTYTHIDGYAHLPINQHTNTSIEMSNLLSHENKWLSKFILFRKKS